MSIQDLSDELLLNILIRLDIGRDVHASLLVCKLWNAISDDEVCWRLRCIRKLGCPVRIDTEAASNFGDFRVDTCGVLCLMLGCSYQQHAVYCPDFYAGSAASWRQHAMHWYRLVQMEQCSYSAACTGHCRVFLPENRQLNLRRAASDFHRTCLLKCFARLSDSYFPLLVLFDELRRVSAVRGNESAVQLCVEFLNLLIVYDKHRSMPTQEELCQYFTQLFQLGVNPNDCHAQLMTALDSGHMNVVRIFLESGYEPAPYRHVSPLAVALSVHSHQFEFLYSNPHGDMKRERAYSHIMCFLYEGSIWGSAELLLCFEEHTRADWWPAMLGEALARAAHHLNGVFITNVLSVYAQKSCWPKIYWNYKHTVLNHIDLWKFKMLRSAHSELSEDEFCCRLLNLHRPNTYDTRLLFLFWIQLSQTVYAHRNYLLPSVRNKLHQALGIQAFISCCDCTARLRVISPTQLRRPIQDVPEPESYIQECLLCAAERCDTPIKYAFDDAKQRMRLDVVLVSCSSKPRNCIVFKNSIFYAINFSKKRRK